MSDAQQGTLPRRMATMLLESTLHIAPAHTVEWGHAMLSELRHVEGSWSALLWSLGSAGVLAKHALVAFIFPTGNRSALPSGGDLFTKESPVRKPALAVIAVCVAASLLFFLAPVFRQAFHVSLAQWHEVLHVNDREQQWAGLGTDPELDALAKKAEQNRDAEALAFVATGYPNAIQAAHFVDETVRLDPNLTWVYGVAGTAYLSSSEIGRRVSVLKQWDPQNALPYLMEAKMIGVTVITVIPSKEFPLGKVQPNPSWEKAMEAAFQSRKLDTYIDRLEQLDRRVLARYHLDGSTKVISERGWYLDSVPTYDIWECSLYAESLLETGQALDSKGDRKAAFEKYLAVARFGQMMGVNGGLWMGFVRRDVKEAYSRLEALSQVAGNKTEAAFYASVADQLDKAAVMERASRPRRVRGSDVTRWDAFEVRLSGLLMLFCAVLFLCCVLGVLVRSRSVRLASLRPSGLILGLGLIAVMGALLSSVVLYASYRPYSGLLQQFVSEGDKASLSELSNFLHDAQLPLGSQFSSGSYYVGVSNVVFYFWFAVTVLCVLAALVAVSRHFQTRRRATTA